jgi:hypothetical protein
VSDRIWAIVVAAIVQATGTGGFLVVRYEDRRPQRCADIGIGFPPAESTPGKALAVFVPRQGGNPNDWVPARRGAGFVTFKTTKSTSLQFASITVAPAAHGWEVMMGKMRDRPHLRPLLEPESVNAAWS